MSRPSTDKTSTLAALGLRAQGGREAQVTSLSVDSRDVQDGTLFFALPGSTVHGGTFIQYALRMGATAILTDAQGADIAAKELAASDAALIIAEDPRGALARTPGSALARDSLGIRLSRVRTLLWAGVDHNLCLKKPRLNSHSLSVSPLASALSQLSHPRALKPCT